MKTINVVAAVILVDQSILCVQRGLHKYDYISKKFEFPGGKVESGESHEEAVTREISEELHKEIRVDRKLLTVDHTYPDFRILMHTFLCFAEDKRVELTEHIASQWLAIEHLSALDWAAADLPIVDK